MNPHRHNQYRLAKLKATSDKFNLVIGVDFDFTLVDSLNNYELYPDIVELLHNAQSVGFALCIWSSNSNQELVVSKWKEANLTWDAYNDSTIRLNSYTSKPHFNILLDDSAGLQQSIELLEDLIKYKKEQQCR